MIYKNNGLFRVQIATKDHHTTNQWWSFVFYAQPLIGNKKDVEASSMSFLFFRAGDATKGRRIGTIRRRKPKVSQILVIYEKVSEKRVIKLILLKTNVSTRAFSKGLSIGKRSHASVFADFLRFPSFGFCW